MKRVKPRKCHFLHSEHRIISYNWSLIPPYFREKRTKRTQWAKYLNNILMNVITLEYYNITNRMQKDVYHLVRETRCKLKNVHCLGRTRNEEQMSTVDDLDAARRRKGKRSLHSKLPLWLALYHSNVIV